MTQLIKRGAVPVMGGMRLFPKQGPKYRYQFDGLSYGLIPAWAAQGTPRAIEISFNANAVSTGTNQYLLSGEEGGIITSVFLQAGSPMLQIQYQRGDGAQGNEVIVDPIIEAGVDTTVRIERLGADARIYVNGVPASIFLGTQAGGILPPITHVGISHTLTGAFSGLIWGLELEDHSPIQDGSYNVSTGTLEGVLNTPIHLQGGDFSISFDWVRRDGTGTGLHTLVGYTGDNNNRVSAHDTLHGSLPNGITLAADGVFTQWADAMDRIEQGQHSSYDITVTGGDAVLTIDGVEIPRTNNPTNDGMVIDSLLWGGGGNNASGTLANLTITGDFGALTEGFFDADSAVIGEQGCVDKFYGGSAGDMGSTAQTGNQGPNFDPVKGFQCVNDTVQLWEAQFVTDNALADGFTLYMEVSAFVFGKDYIPGTTQNLASLFFTGGGADGRNFALWKDKGAWDHAAVSNPVKTDLAELTGYVPVYLVWDKDVGFSVFVDGVLVQQYLIGTGAAGAFGTLLVSGNALFGIGNLPAWKRNVCLWNKPLDLGAAGVQTEIVCLGDSMSQWGAYQSGSTSNAYPPVADPNNNPILQGYIAGPEESLVTRYELKNTATQCVMHRELAARGIYPTDGYIKNYARGGAVIEPTFDRGTGWLSQRVNAALGVLGEPTGGAPGKAQAWVFQIGSNDVFQVGSGNVAGSLDLSIDAYLGQIDRAVADGAQQVLCLYVLPRYNDQGQEVYATERKYFNQQMDARINGYKGARVVDVVTGWNYSMTQGLDPGNDNHPGPTGCEHIGRAIALAFDAPVTGQQTIKWSLKQNADNPLKFASNSSDAYDGFWNGAAFFDYPVSSRGYDMDEGPDGGGVLVDEVGGQDGSIENYNPGNWE